MSQIHFLLIERLKKRVPVALAVIVGSKGSVPQITGASALFSPRKLLGGTLGGGVLEAEVQKKVSNAFKKRLPAVLDFSLKGKIIDEDEAVCGGEARVLIDPRPAAHRAVFEAMGFSLRSGRPGVLVTIVSGAASPMPGIQRFWASREDGHADLEFPRLPVVPQADHGLLLPAGKNLQDLCREEARQVLSGRRPGFKQLRGKRGKERAAGALIFFEPVFPLPRLIIAGAGHIGQALCHLGHLLDFEVTVIDDRPEFASRRRLPGAARIIQQDFRRAFRSLALTPDTYLAIVTRGHRHDADVLRAVILSEAGYIGMIGSRNKIEQMRKHFLNRGWATAAEWSRVHAPIGVPIQSKTVAEIAVSIAAELVLARREILSGGEGPK